MKICVAQTKPEIGQIENNISRHIQMIEYAASYNVEAIFFPELSLSGYEPELADELAIDEDDPRLRIFQELADQHQLMIAVGIPTRVYSDVQISMAIYRPGKERMYYSKQYLHNDEFEYFKAGEGRPEIIDAGTIIAPAICYEISVPGHSRAAFNNGARIYIASVAKSEKGVIQAKEQLSYVARNYSMTVFMSNCIGLSGGMVCAGGSSVWNNKGSQIESLDKLHEGFLIFDPDSSELITEYMD